ncbi:hypothetical protein RHS01_07887 [Rhizoctonia solani]|uniref:Uncharacterized protein n=1 Tax=Rhizoctonia solani TaxID=456999 RepID=A0A8H7LZD7_9AGAM|nr:hypothetical protein RHS01_07887 [Rhizoctonia solani]
MQYDNALDFISTVRHTFTNEPWVYDAFVVVLSEYRKQHFLPDQDQQPCCPSALDFVSYVKSRSAPHLYSAFLSLLNEVERGEVAVSEMYTKTCALFQHDSELMSEFESFFRGEWSSVGDDLSDLDEELDSSSVQSSPSPSVESFTGVQTPKDSGSPLPRTLNLKALSIDSQPQSQPQVSLAGEWSS